MAKIDLNDVASGYNRQRINDNFQQIEAELNDKVLYRDNPTGEPNQMENDLDMNSNDLLNVNDANVQQLKIKGEIVIPGSVAFASLAEDVSYDDTVSPLTGLNVQDALDSVGTSSIADLTTSTTDTTTGRVLKVGDLGLAIAQQIVSSGSYDDLNVPGATYWAGPSLTSSPDGLNAFIVRVSGGMSGANLRLIQKASLVNSTGGIEEYQRTFRTESGWGTWRRFYHTSNLLGTVTQSGGVPTGAVIERGNNANGEYTKFADGTLICKNRLMPGSLTTTGNTFPAEFIDSNGICIVSSPTNSSTTTVLSVKFSDITTDTFTVTLTGAGTTYDIGYIAIGEWF